jgi:hypothetical protein
VSLKWGCDFQDLGIGRLLWAAAVTGYTSGRWGGRVGESVYRFHFVFIFLLAECEQQLENLEKVKQKVSKTFGISMQVRPVGMVTCRREILVGAHQLPPLPLALAPYFQEEMIHYTTPFRSAPC